MTTENVGPLRNMSKRKMESTTKHDYEISNTGFGLVSEVKKETTTEGNITNASIVEEDL